MKQYMAGQIWKGKTMLQIEQCQDETQAIRFELITRKGDPYPQGRYTVKVDIDRPSPVNEHAEFEFNIV